jgi:hypothetical protein
MRGGTERQQDVRVLAVRWGDEQRSKHDDNEIPTQDGSGRQANGTPRIAPTVVSSRARSGSEEPIFDVYAVSQLCLILERHAEIVFDDGVVDESAIALCAGTLRTTRVRHGG